MLYKCHLSGKLNLKSLHIFADFEGELELKQRNVALINGDK